MRGRKTGLDFIYIFHSAEITLDILNTKTIKKKHNFEKVSHFKVIRQQSLFNYHLIFDYAK